MYYKPLKHHRRSIRLSGFDYSKNGMYFITIITFQRNCFFGDVLSPTISMNEPIRFALTNGGEIAKQCWMNIPKHYPNVLLHEFAILPDHIHGIIEIRNNGINEAGYKKTRHHEFQKIIPRSVGSIVRGYKIGVTKWFHENVPSDRVWQRNYHERIIRSKIEYQRITKYIRDNPKNWTPSPFPRRGSKF